MRFTYCETCSEGGGVGTHAALPDVSADQHHARYTDAEAIAAVGPHFSGAHGDLSGVSSDQHHAEDHATRHEGGGADELTAQNLGSGAAAINQIMETDGAGGWNLIATPTGGGGASSAAYSGASVYKSANQAISDGAGVVTLSFDAEEWDTDSYHDNAVNNSRLSVPSIGKYQIEGAVSFLDADSTDRQIRLTRNGTFIKQLYREDSATAQTGMTHSFSVTVEATADTDYFEVEVYQLSGAYDITGGAAWTHVQIGKIAGNQSSQLAVAKMYLSADQTLSNSGDDKIDFDQEDFDTDGSLVDLPNSQFVIQQTGYYYLDGYWPWDGNTPDGDWTLEVFVNGASANITMARGHATSVEQFGSGYVGGLIPLVAGDTVSLYANTGGNSNVVARGNANSWTRASFSIIQLSSLVEPTVGEWQDWSPTYANFSLGNGTAVARYTQIGKTVHGYWKVEFGSTTSLTGSLGLTYPVAQSTNYVSNLNTIGQAFFDDSDVGGARFAGVVASGTSNMNVRTMDISGTYPQISNIGGAIPFTWATGDTIYCEFTYEAA